MLFLLLGLKLLCILQAVSAQTKLASFAANILRTEGTAETLDFDVVYANVGGFLNEQTWKLRIPFDGLYLICLSAGHPGDDVTDYSLIRGTNKTTAIYRDAEDLFSQTILGKDIVLWLSRSEELSIRTDGPHLHSTGENRATSWGAFSLTREFGSPVAFGAARSDNHTAGKVTFDTMWGTTGGGWNESSSTFTAPVSGVYFFAFSTGVASGVRVNMFLRVNGVPTYRLFRNTPTPVETDSMSRAVVMPLFFGETVEVVSNLPGVSNANFLTTFSGFLHDPLKLFGLAWSVSRSSPLTGTQDPVEFENIDVNEGGAWQENHAICAFNGMYYVHISGLTTDLDSFRLSIVIEGMTVGELRKDTPGMEETLSRSVIVHCFAGQTIKLVSSGVINSVPPNRDITFLGFYLFE